MNALEDAGNILRELQNGGRINLFCSAHQAKALLERLQAGVESVGAVFRQEALNARLTTREYLHFFAELWGSSKNHLEEAVQTLHLQDLLNVDIEKLDESQRRRVAFAREAMHPVEVYYLQDPLWAMDEAATSQVLHWLGQLDATVGVLAIFSTAQEAARFPGQPYLLDEQGLHALAQEPQAPPPALTVEKIPAKRAESVYLLDPGEIDFAESVDGRVQLQVQDQRYNCNATLDELEGKLARHGFYRCHRSYLVNMQKVREVVKWTRNSYGLRLKADDTTIPLSKGRIEEMRSLYHF